MAFAVAVAFALPALARVAFRGPSAVPLTFGWELRLITSQPGTTFKDATFMGSHC